MRTKRNVQESDGTLILNEGKLTGGTKLTVKYAREQHKPLLVIQLDREHRVDDVLGWLNEYQIKSLNIAGPRESGVPGIYQRAKAFLLEAIGRS